MFLIVYVAFYFSLTLSVPIFDSTALMSRVLVPADVPIGSVIFRLRASDTSFNYPLIFTLESESTVVSIENLNCSRFNSVCQSNVVIQRHLEAGVFYDFSVAVQNPSKQYARMQCSFRATNATTPLSQIFPGAPSLLTISESAQRNTELGTLIAKGDTKKERAVLLELWGSSKFGLRQRLVHERNAEGTIILLSPLDYETTNLYYLSILANDVWTESGNDTRNIVGWPLVVAVIDEQDTPPIFTQAPPVTEISPDLHPGDLILQVKAEDGDRGRPRDIRYGLLPENNALASFFTLAENTGELRLSRPLLELQAKADFNSPIILSIIAEEIRTSGGEPPSQSTTVQLALIPPPPVWDIPHFSNSRFTLRIEENALPGTNLNLSSVELIIQQGEVLTLGLENNNGTFEITPSVIEYKSKFSIIVRDNHLLDYEARRYVECIIIAREFKSGNHSVSAKLIIMIIDVNDNPPVFERARYQAEIQENSQVGTSVIKVHADDVDTGIGGHVTYTGISGLGSDYFRLDPVSGVISVIDSKGLDDERTQVFIFSVEAADEEGQGLKATTQLTISLLDMNDEVPKFDKELYEFIIDADKKHFTSPAFIKAIDLDVSAPNNEVHYELISPNEDVVLDSNTGEFSLLGTWKKIDLLVLKVRAYDRGVPRLWSDAEVRIYPPESKTNTISFVVPGSNHNPDNIKKELQILTGGEVFIEEIQPYLSDFSSKIEREQSSVVKAVIQYPSNTIVEFDRIQKLFLKNEKETDEVQKAGVSDNLWWLFLIVAILLLLTIIFLLCCLCESCPLYVPPHKLRVAPAVQSIQTNIKEVGASGNQSKSVQVAEWFGRREAWTPEGILVDNEVDSIKQHELERGSNGDLRRKTVLKRGETVDRDQLYIREGNTDILRLITRGGEQTNHQQKNFYQDGAQTNATDNGNIILKRFIDQQEMTQAKMGSLHHESQKAHETQENLESVLKEQNSLLRQIILEREREVRLETQSLPAGTQTDRNTGTQTEELYFLRPPQRKIYSDNDASDRSEPEDEILLTRLRGRKRKEKKRRKLDIKRKITTPIREESESAEYSESHKNSKNLRDLILKDILLHGVSKSEVSTLGIKKEILTEIFNSLDSPEETLTENKNKKKLRKQGKYQHEIFSSDSLEDEDRPQTIRFSKTNPKYKSEINLSENLERPDVSQLKISKSQSNLDLSQGKNKVKSKKGGSRYMEWYTKSKKTGNDIEEKPKSEAKNASAKIVDPVQKQRKTKSLASESSGTSSGKSFRKRHPLLQHSQHRFEPRRNEDDVDSGIALVKPAITQKKSIFSIAYEDVKTKKLRPDSTST